MSSISKEKKKETGRLITALVKEIQAGDSSKRNDLAILILDAVKPVVAKFYRDYNDRMEVMNYITTKIINKISYIDIKKPVLNYILFTTRNYCIDEYRKKMRQKGRFVNLDNETLDLIPVEQPQQEMLYEDYIDLYTIATSGDAEAAKVYYALEQENIPPTEVADLYKLPVTEVLEIQHEASTVLKSIKRKLSLSKT